MATAPANKVINPDLRICALLMQLAGHHQLHYCHPSQAKIIELLKQFTGRVMSRRTLNRHLAALCELGYLRRTRRHQYHRRRGFLLRSTLYHIGGRYLAQLRNMARGVQKFRDSLERSSASIRVPASAQYAKSLLKILVSRATYPQARPPDPPNRAPR